MDELVLLADPESNAWALAERIQEYIKQRYSKDVPLIEMATKIFRNGEIHVEVKGNVRRKEVYFIHDSSLNPSEWWVKLLLVKDALLRASVEKVAFVLPDLLYSRQDRKDKPHVPISARALSDSISQGLSRIITIDIHADQIQGFYPSACGVDTLHSFPIVVNYIQKNSLGDLKNLVIVSPDAGGVKRAKAFKKKLGATNPIALIDKDRPDAGEVGEMKLVGNVAGYNALIIDDILDSGNTLCKAAKLLKESGAKQVYCYATHGIFTNGTCELCNYFDRIMVSNTHFSDKLGDSKVEVVDISPLLAEAIYRAHTGESISQLFGMDYNWDL